MLYLKIQNYTPTQFFFFLPKTINKQQYQTTKKPISRKLKEKNQISKQVAVMADQFPSTVALLIAFPETINGSYSFADVGCQ